MKNIINNFTTLCLIIFLMSNCSKTEFGDVIFWQQTGSGFGITVVEINGITSDISSEFNFLLIVVHQDVLYLITLKQEHIILVLLTGPTIGLVLLPFQKVV